MKVVDEVELDVDVIMVSFKEGEKMVEGDVWSDELIGEEGLEFLV